MSSRILKTDPKRLARNTVARAIRKGQMPPVTSLPCICCGSPAREYHHHKGYDIEQRLNVIPLCTNCHVVTYKGAYRHSPETIEKMRASQLRRNQDPAERAKSKYKSPEGLEKIRLANKGLPQSIETRMKRSESLRKAWERHRNQA